MTKRGVNVQKISKLPFLPRFVKKVVINAPGLFPTMRSLIYSAGEICHSDVIYFAHACAGFIYDIANACTCSCTEK